MHTVKIYFSKDKKTGRKLVYTACNGGPVYVERWADLSDEMQMILRAVANPDLCKIEVSEKGFEDINVEQ